jgi:hypothetical protein
MSTTECESDRWSEDRYKLAHNVNHLMTGDAQGGELNSRKPEVERVDEKERERR